jgi:hypothetical protein
MTIAGKGVSGVLAAFDAEGYGWILVAVEGKRFARGANAHLVDDETVAKMGHPDFVVGQTWATRPSAPPKFVMG